MSTSKEGEAEQRGEPVRAEHDSDEAGGGRHGREPEEARALSAQFEFTQEFGFVLRGPQSRIAISLIAIDQFCRIKDLNCSFAPG